MKLTPARTGLFLAISALLSPGVALGQASTAAPQSQSAPAQTGAVQATTAAAAPMQATDLDSVKVQGEYIPEPMLLSSAVMSHVSKEDLDRQGDSTAADALTRVAGISLNHGRYVYVRGLNERYSSALLNNSPLPSPEPLKRVVPLDLFPTNVLETIEVRKTYSATMPGEFGGGTINLSSAVVPEEAFLDIKLGTGGNSE
ncbi:MAG: TonB-dependent receptor plug domain-containing protein, partial [Lysobacter spongiicola]|nr:TonB-dependent receptor plug domain-containing protein [Lysobacter spongiicola]